MHRRKVGHGQAKQSRKLSELKRFCGFDSRTFLFFGGAAQKAVQLRAKQPGVRAPVRSSRTASASEMMNAE